MLIYKIYKYFFPQVCSGCCFLIRFANTVFFFFFKSHQQIMCYYEEPLLVHMP